MNLEHTQVRNEAQSCMTEMWFVTWGRRDEERKKQTETRDSQLRNGWLDHTNACQAVQKRRAERHHLT